MRKLVLVSLCLLLSFGYCYGLSVSTIKNRMYNSRKYSSVQRQYFAKKCIGSNISVSFKIGSIDTEKDGFMVIGGKSYKHKKIVHSIQYKVITKRKTMPKYNIGQKISFSGTVEHIQISYGSAFVRIKAMN